MAGEHLLRELATDVQSPQGSLEKDRKEPLAWAGVPYVVPFLLLKGSVNTMNLSYKQVSPEEVDALHDILRLCGQDMKDRLGLSHWVPPYPLDAMRRSAQERQVHAVWLDDRVVATFTVGTQPPAYYRTIPGVWEAWDASIQLAMYVNRLAVLPSLQGQGIGRWCMHLVEHLSLQQSCEAIRLDAYDKHSGLHLFYTKLGYRHRGSFTFFTKGYGETGMVCFEKRAQDFESSFPPAT